MLLSGLLLQESVASLHESSVQPMLSEQLFALPPPQTPAVQNSFSLQNKPSLHVVPSIS
jgi:hypothetical protein